MSRKKPRPDSNRFRPKKKRAGKSRDGMWTLRISFAEGDWSQSEIEKAGRQVETEKEKVNQREDVPC